LLKNVKNEISAIMDELLAAAKLKEGDLFVAGCSTSEVLGERIGTASDAELGSVIFETVFQKLKEKGVFLAAQGCEHINRALVVERELALKRGYEIVNVVPRLHAGGAFSMAAYKGMKDPVMVETVKAQAGIDIGDTFIGMHLVAVVSPVRLKMKKLGNAHVTAARTRPRYVGGPRAEYDAALK